MASIRVYLFQSYSQIHNFRKCLSKVDTCQCHLHIFGLDKRWDLPRHIKTTNCLHQKPHSRTSIVFQSLRPWIMPQMFSSQPPMFSNPSLLHKLGNLLGCTLFFCHYWFICCGNSTCVVVLILIICHSLLARNHCLSLATYLIFHEKMKALHILKWHKDMVRFPVCLIWLKAGAKCSSWQAILSFWEPLESMFW